MEIKTYIEGTVKDLVADLLYYDRKEDNSLPRGAIEQAIKDGIITKEEIINVFTKALEDNL